MRAGARLVILRRASRRDRLESRGTLSGPARVAADRNGRRAGARAGDRRLRAERSRACRFKPAWRAACDTARPLAQRSAFTLETDRDLIEIAHGTWEGRLRATIERDDPQTMRAVARTSATACSSKAASRCATSSTLARVCRNALGDADGVAIVTHDVIVRLAILTATQRRLRSCGNRAWSTAGTRVFRGGGSWELVDACVDAHLGGLAVDTAAQAL